VTTRPWRRALAAVGAVCTLALVAAACGGDDGESAATTTETTAAPTTTTTEPTTTTTEAPRPVAPLTGLPVDDEAALDRPALVLKIDNHPNARPQVGINQADVVYEELVEGISRLAAVFHSTDSDPVGPVRSARQSDIDIVAALDRPLFGFSGANAGVLRSVRAAANTIDASWDALPGSYWRDRERRAPHNLFTNTSDLFAAAPDDAAAPDPLFFYRDPDDAAPAGEPVVGVSMRFSTYEAVYVWDPDAGTWRRSLQGTPHVDADGVRVAPENVVVLFTPYSFSADGSPIARTVGEGDAWVLTEGVLVRGRWVRPTADEPALLVDDAGTAIELSPGRTWVGLPRPGEASILTEDPIGE
jgi:hypothetical protein